MRANKISPHSDSVGILAAADTQGPPGSVMKPLEGLLSPTPLSVMLKVIWLPLITAFSKIYQCGSWLPPNSGPYL